MTKQEKIKKEWANYYSEKVNDNGWLDIEPQQFANEEYFDRLKFNSERHSIRPKSLQGIENNNGWIKIESEDDLPNENTDCYLYFTDGECYVDRFLVNCKSFTKHPLRYISHYKPIEKPKPPIY